MESGHVILAIEEQEKWRGRRKRLVERLRQIQSRKRYFARELEAVRRKIDRSGAFRGSMKRTALDGIRSRISGRAVIR
jgi:hypothetical protein